MNPINPLQALDPIVDREGRPIPQFQINWQTLLEHIQALELAAADAEARLTAGGL